MRTARQLLEALLEATVRQPDAAIELFAEEAAYEAPYLESLGLPWRYRGRVEVGGFLEANQELLPRPEFYDLLIVAEAEGRVVAEYQFTARSTRTSRVIHQLVVVRLESAAGKITLLRESLNLVEVALALYPHGFDLYRLPSDR